MLSTPVTQIISNNDSVNNDDSSFDSDNLESDSDDQESSNTEDTHLDECSICGDGGELICCDGCEKAYHVECLGVDANTLPEVWYGPCCEKRLPIKRQPAVCSLAQKGVKSMTDKNQADDQGKGSEEGLGVVPAAEDSISNKSRRDATEARDAKKKQEVESFPSIRELTQKNFTEQSYVHQSRQPQLQCCQMVSNSVGNSQFASNPKHATIDSSSFTNINSLLLQSEQLSLSTATPQPMSGSFCPVINSTSCDECQLLCSPCTTTVDKALSHAPTNGSTITSTHDASTRVTHYKSSEQSTFRTVVVPRGVVEGSIFHVVMENAQRMGVICPKGVQPGQTMIVLEPGVDVAPISPETIVEINESRLVEGFDRREAEFVRRAFWEVLFPRLIGSGWSFTRETNYNFGAYRFYASGNSNQNNSDHRMETIADILKFVESNGCCCDEVQEFHRHVERQKEETRRGSNRKRKRSQDAGITKDEKQIRVGGKHQVRRLPRSGSNEPLSSKEYIYEQIWSRDEAPPEACTFLESLPHRCREEAFCSLHTVCYDPGAVAPSHTINTNKEKFQWNEWAEDSSFAADFHKAIMKCKKEMRDMSSTLEKPVGFCLWYYYSKYKPSENYAVLKRHMKELQMQESRNGDECAICEGGGELLCCDTCSNAYHLKCLGFSDTAAIDGEESWSCPDCIQKRTASCRSPPESRMKAPRLDESPQKLSFREHGTNANAQPRKSSEIENRMPEPVTLRPFNITADSSTTESVLPEEARKSDTPAVIEASHRDFTRERATMGHMKPLQNSSALSTTGTGNMPFQFGVFSSHNFPHNKAEEKAKEKYDYGDRYSFQNTAARKRGDGTVLPISLKRLPNGEYARPIGRQRNGMQWDGVRGLWVPVPCKGNPWKRS